MRDALSMFDKAVSFCGRELHYQEVAQTLNVLDYDTYFHVTGRLLAGDYVQALLAFDEVLTRGFAGQTFLAGLNRHLRDLLVAKDAATLRLIEMTGTLLERYRVQAEACDVAFLFGAISVLTELDSKIRQSSGQRLLVELGLMKIAGLGQKNNPDSPLIERELSAARTGDGTRFPPHRHSRFRLLHPLPRHSSPGLPLRLHQRSHDRRRLPQRSSRSDPHPRPG